MLKFSDGTQSKRVRCPLCGAENVVAFIDMSYLLKEECEVYENGVEYVISPTGSINSEISGPRYTVRKYKCNGCEKTWKAEDFDLAYDENFLNGHFVKSEMKA